MQVQDIIFNSDISAVNGDLYVDYSDTQHMEDIIKANPGQFYQWPDIGYGIIKNLLGNINVAKEQQAIKRALENDNYDVSSVNIVKSGDSYTVDAMAKRIR